VAGRHFRAFLQGIARSYKANGPAAIESIIEADPIANCVQAIMVDRTM
jgi:hypothetical protein